MISAGKIIIVIIATSLIFELLSLIPTVACKSHSEEKDNYFTENNFRIRMSVKEIFNADKKFLQPFIIETE